VLAAAFAVLVCVLPAPASAAPSRPTVDPAAPTPTSPYPGGPPQGHAPDGQTVGGEQLDTRGLVVAEGAPALPDGLAAAGWLVADAGTGAVLAARDPHGRYYPASTLKTLTLLTLVPLLDPARVVVGTAEDENVEGSRVGLVQGGQYPVSLLFQALILQSGNDAANALARAAGGVEVTVAAMNETAEDIGAFDTVAGTPSGLDVAGQSSSPYDLALIFRALVSAPATAAILTTPTATMPAVEGRSPGYQIQSQNPLLSAYPGNLGGKTGFTDAARHTFVTAAERDGRRLVVSVMATENTPLRGSEGVGTLVTPGHVLPSPSAVPSTSARPTVRPPPVSGAAPAAPTDGFPLIPVTLAGSAVLIVAATVAGRRRAVRPVPSSVRDDAGPPVRRAPARRPAVEPESPARPTGGSPSTPP
jgi:D-alanyl-D-alanine carboxypeptidase (penicillin-binding protein 5/6)